MQPLFVSFGFALIEAANRGLAQTNETFGLKMSLHKIGESVESRVTLMRRIPCFSRYLGLKPYRDLVPEELDYAI